MSRQSVPDLDSLIAARQRALAGEQEGPKGTGLDLDSLIASRQQALRGSGPTDVAPAQADLLARSVDRSFRAPSRAQAPADTAAAAPRPPRRRSALDIFAGGRAGEPAAQPGTVVTPRPGAGGPRDTMQADAARVESVDPRAGASPSPTRLQRLLSLPFRLPESVAPRTWSKPGDDPEKELGAVARRFLTEPSERLPVAAEIVRGLAREPGRMVRGAGGIVQAAAASGPDALGDAAKGTVFEELEGDRQRRLSSYRSTVGTGLRAVGEALEDIGTPSEEFFPRSTAPDPLDLTDLNTLAAGGSQAVSQIGVQLMLAAATGGAGSVGQFLMFAGPTVALEGGNKFYEERDRLIAKGLDAEKAEALAAGVAVSTGLGALAIERVPFGRFVLNRIPGADRILGAKMAAALAGRGGAVSKILSGGGVEAVQETLQEVWSSFIQDIQAKDPEAWKDIGPRLASSAVFGSIGGAFGGGVQVVGERTGYMPKPPDAPPGAAPAPPGPPTPAPSGPEASMPRTGPPMEPGVTAPVTPRAPAPAATEKPGVRRRIAEIVDPTVRTELEEAYTDRRTGLGSRQAYNAARERIDTDPGQHVLLVDMANAKGSNDMQSWAYTDARLKEAADLLRPIAEKHGIPERDLFSPAGDELVVTAPTPEIAEEIGARLQEAFGEQEIEGTGYHNWLRYGVGNTFAEAEAAANAKKPDERLPHYRGGAVAAQAPEAVPAAAEPTPRPAPSAPAPSSARPPAESLRKPGVVDRARPFEDGEEVIVQPGTEFAEANPDLVGKRVAVNIFTDSQGFEDFSVRVGGKLYEALPEDLRRPGDADLEAAGQQGLFEPEAAPNEDPYAAFAAEFNAGDAMELTPEGAAQEAARRWPELVGGQGRRMAFYRGAAWAKRGGTALPKSGSEAEMAGFEWAQGTAPTAPTPEAEAAPEPAPKAKPAPKSAPAPSPAPAEALGAKNTLVGSDRAAELRAKLKAKLVKQQKGQPKGVQGDPGFDSEMASLGTELTVFYAEAGIRGFSDLARQLAQDLDVPVATLRPYLRSWYNGARDMMEDHGIDVADMDAPDAVRATLASIDAESEIPTEEATADESEAEPAGSDRSSSVEEPGGGILEGQGPGDVSQPEPAPEGGVPGRAGGEGEGDVRVDVPGAESQAPGEGGVVPGRRPGTDDSGRSGPNSVTTPARNPGKIKGEDYHLTAEEITDLGGPKTRARSNIEAVRVVKRLEEERRPATREEQAALAKYVGWGGLADLFPATSGYGWAKKETWKDATWETLHQEFKEIVTDEDYQTAKRSTQYAHYTSPEVIGGIYEAAKRLGVKGRIRALEPGAGIGHFVGLSEVDARWTTVEMDHLSAAILRGLYPSANTFEDKYENVILPDNTFDLVVGNPPFGDIPIKDRRYKGTTLIHDYFFLKSLDKLRPGGILAFVTSTGTMDKGFRNVRMAMGERANFLGAIRLPGGAFQKTAATMVTTDIIFFQKRLPGQAPVHVADWMAMKKVEATDTGEKYQVNEYFVDHPHMVLGEWVQDRLHHTRSGVAPREGVDLPTALSAAIESLPSDLYVVGRPAGETEGQAELVEADAGLREGQWLHEKGKMYEVRNGKKVPLDIDTQTPAGKRVVALVEMADVVGGIFTATREQVTDKELQQLQKRLTKLYDAFVKQHGPINRVVLTKKGGKTRPNLRGYNDPVSLPRVWALERYDEDSDRAEKTDIFTRRMFNAERAMTNIQSAADALVASKATLGKVDMPYMVSLYGKTEEEIVAELEGQVFVDPLTGLYEAAETYLSGNVKERLAVATEAAQRDSRFRTNVEHLEKVQPPDVSLSQMRKQMATNIGTTWIDAKTYAAFVHEVMGVANVSISYREIDGQWLQSGGTVSRPALHEEWSTSVVDAQKLFRDLLNRRPTKVIWKDSTGQKHEDKEAGEAAEAKKLKIQERFTRWLLDENEQRAERAHRRYNDLMNHTVLPSWDGSHLRGRMPGMATEFRGKPMESRLMVHQLDGTWRYLSTGNELLAWEVGAGKTIAAAMIGQEAKRMGLARKPTYAVPNNMLQQFSAELLEVYPGAKIIVADEENFAAPKRQRFLAQVAANDWDAVVMTHSALGLIPTTPEHQQYIISELVAEYQEVLAQAVAAGERGAQTTKQLQQALEKLERRLTDMAEAGGRKDNTVYWEDLGIDLLIVDEAHEFKNLPLPAFGPLAATKDTQKTVDLYSKSRHLDRVNPGRGMVFLTATPISNTIQEQYVMLRYLAEPKLRKMGYGTVTGWANDYVASWSKPEFTAIGTLEPKHRARAYSNAFSMAQLFRSVADVKLAEDLDLDVPALKGGKPEMVIVPGTKRLKSFMKMLQRRWTNRPKGKPQKGDDGVFPIINDGRFGSVDARLVTGPHARASGHDASTSWDHSKAEASAKRIYTIWKDTKEILGTQLVFSDLGVPHEMRASEREALVEHVMEEDDLLTREDAERLVDEEMGDDAPYDAYNDIKGRLIEMGIPEAEIAFIQEAKSRADRQATIRKVREGKVRVLIGSTATMGQGTNVQDRLVALHHIDVPYKPAWLQQREGRIVRQGNNLWRDKKVPYVRIFRYALKGSYDVRAWQILENKIGFITQAMTARPDVGLVEETGDKTLSAEEAYAIIKSEASDNPYAMDWAVAKGRVRSLKNARDEHKDSLFRLRQLLAREEQQLRHWVDRKRSAETDNLALRKDREPVGEKFEVEVNGQRYSDRAEAGKAIANIMIEKSETARLRKQDMAGVRIGEYAGMGIEASYQLGRFTLTLRGIGEYHGYPNISWVKRGDADPAWEFSPEGVATTLENLIERMRQAPEDYGTKVSKTKETITGYESRLGEAFPEAADLEQAEAELKDLDAKMKTYKGELDWNNAMPSEDASLFDKAMWNVENAVNEDHMQKILFTWRGGTIKDAETAANFNELDKQVEAAAQKRLAEIEKEAPPENVEDDWEMKGSWMQEPGESPKESRARERDASVNRAKATARLASNPLLPGGPTLEIIGDRMSGSLENAAETGDGTVNVPQVLRALSKVTAAAGKQIPMRTGFIRGRRARGQYDVRAEVIRTRSANNIPTSVHEVAHAVERLLYGSPHGGPWKSPLATGPMQRELVALGRELYGDTVPNGGYKREGWAEYLRTWVTETDLDGRVADPASVAPKVHAWFEGEFAKSFPAVWKELQNVRKLVRVWRHQGSMERGRESMVTGSALRARASKLGQDVRRLFSMEKLVELAAPLNRLAREAELRQGKALKPSEDPYFTLGALRTTHSARVEYMVETGMIDLAGNVVGPGLSQVRKLVAGQRVDFALYLWARRTIALASRAEGARDTGLSIQDARAIFDELDSPRFQMAADLVYSWNAGVLEYTAQASPTFQMVVDRVHARDAELVNVRGEAAGDYVPLQRVFEEMDDMWRQVRGRGNAGPRSPVRAMKGSGRRVKDVFDSMISNAENMVRQSHKRMVLDQIMRLAQLPGMGDILEEVPVRDRPVATRTIQQLLDEINDQLKPRGAMAVVVGEDLDTDVLGHAVTFFAPVDQKGQDRYVVPIYDQGRVRWFYVPGILYDALQSIDVYRLPDVAGLPLLEWGAGKPAAVMRAGTTGLRASFGLVWNPLRDVQTLWVNTQSSENAGWMFHQFIRSWGAMGLSRLTGTPATEWVDLWMRIGGPMAQPLGQDMAHTTRAARRLFEGRVVRIVDPRNWFDWYREFIQFPEGAPRVTEIKAIAKQVGWEPGQPMTLDQSFAMLLGSKEVTTDFTAAGELGRVMNRYAPFHNAAIQGPRANIRAAKRDPVKFAWHGLHFTLLSLALWYLNKDKEWYKALPYRDRFLNWWFEHDWPEKGLIGVPRAFEVGMIFAALPEMLADAWYRQQPEQAKAYFKTLLSTSTPNVMPVVPGIALEQVANKEFYFDRPIVPLGESRRPLEEQYNEYTTRAAIALGDVFNISPRRIDHVVRNFFGPVGHDVLGVLGLGTPELDREKELADTPIVGRLFRRGGKTGTSPRPFDEMYEALEDAQKRQYSIKSPESEDERQYRLQLNDAATAVSALLYVRRYTRETDGREKLTREALAIADAVLEATKAQRLDREEFANERRAAEYRRKVLEAERSGEPKPPRPPRPSRPTRARRERN